MNSLEKFNQLYLEESSRSYEKSLYNFFSSVVSSKLPSSPLRILDLGPGSKSIFEDTDLDQSLIDAIDFSPIAILKAKVLSKINYTLLDLTKENALESKRYDLIFDSHCLHCLTEDAERKSAFQNIYEALDPNGIFCTEMMIQPIGKEVAFPFKHIDSARGIEDELIRHGFKIIYLMVVRDLNFLYGQEICDVVRVIAKK